MITLKYILKEEKPKFTIFLLANLNQHYLNKFDLGMICLITSFLDIRKRKLAGKMNGIVITTVGTILCWTTFIHGFRHGVPTFPRPNVKNVENKENGYGYKTLWYTQVVS